MPTAALIVGLIVSLGVFLRAWRRTSPWRWGTAVAAVGSVTAVIAWLTVGVDHLTYPMF